MDHPPTTVTTLDDEVTFGLGEISLFTPPGTFQITPASLISMEGVGRHKGLLSGIGIDWGSGGGCLSIAAGKIPAVNQVIGLDISEANVDIARKTAQMNGLQDKLTFCLSGLNVVLYRDGKPICSD